MIWSRGVSGGGCTFWFFGVCFFVFVVFLGELHFFDGFPEFVDFLDEVDVFAHDADVVLLVDFVIFDEVLLEHGDGLLEVLLLAHVLLLDVLVDLDWLHV